MNLCQCGHPRTAHRQALHWRDDPDDTSCVYGYQGRKSDTRCTCTAFVATQPEAAPADEPSAVCQNPVCGHPTYLHRPHTGPCAWPCLCRSFVVNVPVDRPDLRDAIAEALSKHRYWAGIGTCSCGLPVDGASDEQFAIKAHAGHVADVVAEVVQGALDEMQQDLSHERDMHITNNKDAAHWWRRYRETRAERDEARAELAEATEKNERLWRDGVLEAKRLRDGIKALADKWEQWRKTDQSVPPQAAAELRACTQELRALLSDPERSSDE